MANVYGFDPVAWAVDGGRHGGELLRVLAYAATSGSEGIISLGDCKVHELGNPGPVVAIDPGALLIRNRAANVRNQTYVANGRTETRLDVRRTDATPRSDLVIVRIEDPQYAGWTQPSPAAAPTYQYTKPFIIENVPSNTTDVRQLNLGYAAYALARIDLPAGTTNVTDAMIKNLRQVANPRSRTVFAVLRPNPGETALDDVRDGQYHWFPVIRHPLDVPEWAARVELEIVMSGILRSDKLFGEIRPEFGFGTGNNPQFVSAAPTGLHYDISSKGRFDISVAAVMDIPASYRGKTQFAGTGTLINTGSAVGVRLEQDSYTTSIVKARFVEAAA